MRTQILSRLGRSCDGGTLYASSVARRRKFAPGLPDLKAKGLKVAAERGGRRTPWIISQQESPPPRAGKPKPRTGDLPAWPSEPRATFPAPTEPRRPGFGVVKTAVATQVVHGCISTPMNER
jgi:hypothetical protein